MPERELSTAAGQVFVFPDALAASHAAAERIESAIRSNGQSGRGAVLGLATGGTPIRVYQELVAKCVDGRLSFKNVTTFNLDEFYPISPFDRNSYRAYMQRHLFEHVDIAPNRAHVLDGTVPVEGVADHAAEFDRWIAAAGGLDLQLLGIGRNGHIGFNEPSDLPVSEACELRTRLISLHPVTTADAARDFGGDPTRVPATALTLGTQQILAARSILVLAFGAQKTNAVTDAIRGPIQSKIPASLLQTVAPKVTWMLDVDAGRLLTSA